MDIDDAVLQLRVPEIIVNSAVKSATTDKLGGLTVCQQLLINKFSDAYFYEKLLG